MSSDRARAEYREGPEAASRFNDTINRVINVSKVELDKREAAYKKSRRAKKTRQARTR